MSWVIPKKFFFDRGAVIAAVGKARATVMGKAGAFIRRTAQFSIRPRKRPSKPGQPPTNQTGLLRQHIYFQYDPETRSVVVGPAKAPSKKMSNRPIPSILEFGGDVQVLEQQLSGGLWVRGGDPRFKHGASRPTRTRTATIAPRPFMRPALEKNRDKIAKFWQNALIQVRS